MAKKFAQIKDTLIILYVQMRDLQKRRKIETPAMIDYLFYNLGIISALTPVPLHGLIPDSYYEKIEKNKWFPIIV